MPLGNILDLGFSIYADKQANKRHDESLRMAQDQFNAQMDQSISRRVADAKRSGIHPLFALGASVGASPTLSAGGSGPTSRTASAAGRMGDRMNALLMQQLEDKSNSSKAAAKRDEAEAALLNSERMKNLQSLHSRGRDGVIPPSRGAINDPVLSNDPVYGPAEYVPPQVQTSQRTGVASGTHPENIQIMGEDGHKLTIPNPDLGLDEIAQGIYVGKKAKSLVENYVDAWRDNRTAPSNRNIAMLDRAYKEAKRNPESAALIDKWIKHWPSLLKKKYDNWRN